MSDRSILDRPAPEPDRVLPYGDDPAAGHRVIDLFLPSSTTTPGWVLLVHGGFWRAEWDRTHLRPLAVALRDHGYDVALPEYARTGMAGGGWPGTFADVSSAVEAVRRLAGEAGQRVVLVGHSAGGHLATWLLHQPGAAPGEGLADVTGAVSLAGCLDLALVADLDLDEGAAVDLLGGSPAQVPDRYAATDPARLGPTPYPVVVVHGTADEQVPLAVSEGWWAAAATHGRDRRVILEGVDHFGLIDPDHPAFTVLVEQIGRVLAGR